MLSKREVVLTVSLLLAQVVAVLSVLLWSFNRGLDVTDEGFYLTASQHPFEFPYGFTFAFNYTALLASAAHQNIIWMRVAGLGLLISASFCFSAGFTRLLRRMWPGWPIPGSIAHLFVLLGALFFYLIAARTPSYNLLNVTAIQGSMGLILYFCGAAEMPAWRPAWREHLALFGCGLVTGLELLAKFSSAILLATAYAVLLYSWPGLRLRQRHLSLAILAGGIGAWLAFHALVIQAPLDLIRTFQAGIAITHAMGSTHEISRLAPQYILQSGKLAVVSLTAFWACHLLLLTVRLTARHGARAVAPRQLALAMLLLLVLGAASSYHLRLLPAATFGDQQLYENGLKASQFLLGWLFVIAHLNTLIPVVNPGGPPVLQGTNARRLGLLALLLLAAPFISAIGSNNAIYLQTTIAAAPWAALLLLAAGLLLLHARLPRPAPLLMLAIIATYCATQLALAGITHPAYRQLTSYLKQTVPTRIGAPATSILLDPATSAFFKDMRTAAARCQFRPGAPVVALYDQPGLVFALGGRSVGIPWYIGGYEGSIRAAELALKRVPPALLKRTFVIEHLAATRQLPDLAAYGLDFPQGYHLCGAAVWPLSHARVKLWKPAN